MHVSCLYMSTFLGSALQSCVGLMLRQVKAERSWATATVFSAPASRSEQDKWVEKKLRDKKASEYLNGKSFHLGFSVGDTLPDVDHFTEGLRQLMSIFTPKVVYVPLGIGASNHVKFIRHTMQSLYEGREKIIPKMLYYEDRPDLYFNEYRSTVDGLSVADSVMIHSSAYKYARAAFSHYDQDLIAKHSWFELAESLEVSRNKERVYREYYYSA